LFFRILWLGKALDGALGLTVREPAQAKRTLEALVEAGLAQAHGAPEDALTRWPQASIKLMATRRLTRGKWGSRICSMNNWY
jgi:hypothetical protein